MPDNPITPTKLTLFYPKLNIYGASSQGRVFDGVASLEAGYYDSRDDQSGDNPMIPNSQTRYLVGYQRQLWEDFTLVLQYYGEYMEDYSAYVQIVPPGFPQEKRLHQLATVRLTQFLMNQTLKLSFFAFYGLSDGDYLLNPEVKYNLTDAVWIAVGGNVFGGGKPWSQFGQFAKDNNVYTQLRYEF
jgi:predicted porin